MKQRLLKVLLLTTLSTPVLAGNDVIVSYSSNENTNNNSTQTNKSVMGKVTRKIFKKGGDLYIGVKKSDYKMKSISSDSNALIWRYNFKQGKNIPISLSVGTDFINSKWKLGSTSANIRATGIYIYADKKFKIRSLNIIPSVEYQATKYKTSTAFKQLDEKTTRFGVTLYHNINPKLEMGLFLGSRKIENKMITTNTVDSKTNFSTKTNWFGIYRPYIKYNLHKRLKITISQERFSYKAGGTSQTTFISLGYDFK